MFLFQRYHSSGSTIPWLLRADLSHLPYAHTETREVYPAMVSLSRFALATLGVAHGANAWGVLGHAAVAYVAQSYVCPEAASW